MRLEIAEKTRSLGSFNTVINNELLGSNLQLRSAGGYGVYVRRLRKRMAVAAQPVGAQLVGDREREVRTIAHEVSVSDCRGSMDAA